MYKTILTSLLLVALGNSASADDTPFGQLVDVQLAEKAMELAVKASIRDSCLNAGKLQEDCVAKSSVTDKLNLKWILEEVYSEAYSQEQINILYRFYSTPTGRKYSQLMLSIFSEELGYRGVIERPQLSESENRTIDEFQKSDVSKMEAAARPRIQASLSKHLSAAFHKVNAKN